MTSIDLNCDVGEHEDLASEIQESLMGYVTSVSVACGAHAGDDTTMRLTLAQARACGVTVGAHPGYPDRANFGRIEMDMSIMDLEASVESQLRLLSRLASEAGIAMRYVKPHGALYNRAAKDLDLARAIARAVIRVDGNLAIVGLARSPALTLWRASGMRTVPEAFADRRYEPDGSLRSRRYPDALIQDPEAAASQAIRIALQQHVVAWDGAAVQIPAETLCIHGDTPGAVNIALNVRQQLERADVQVCPWRFVPVVG